jgi:FtsP/CotA-like multicopper oxidase with cupredoxin domain
MDRRTFVGLLGAGAGLALPEGLAAWEGLASAQEARRYPLARMDAVAGDRLTLTARTADVDVGPGVVSGLSLNGVVPSPTIRMRRGQTAHIDLVNQLSEPTILHWHGLAVPESADGHPRLQIGPGATYSYEFQIVNRPGTYWYHPHTDRMTGSQTYRGMGGFLIVEGDEDEEHGLPGSSNEIPLLLQDKRLGGGLSLQYGLGMGPDMMMGYLGDTAFGNGVANPTLDVRREPYRFRILNGSNARILELGLSTGDALTLVGSDGGLLAAPTPLDRITLAPAERVDVVVDFSGHRPGERIMLRSLPFEVPGMMAMGMMGGGRGRGGRGMGRGMGGGGLPQGAPMDLLELAVQDTSPEPGHPLPKAFGAVPSRGDVTADTPRRTFRFNSQMMRGMSHTINGRTFELLRVDERVPLNRTEIWSFVNESQLPHPVHVHAGQFRVLARTGGRGRVLPWETGLKDTVLTLPGETVDVAVRFVYPGLYLLHCHNLEHEDMGMMLNFQVEG